MSEYGCLSLIGAGAIGFFLGTCCSGGCSSGLEKRISSLEQYIPQPKTENILGQDFPEVFYVIYGRRAYVSIDNQDIEALPFLDYCPLEDTQPQQYTTENPTK